MATYVVTLEPGEWKAENKVFATRGGQTNMSGGYARLTVVSGSGVVGYASVVDNVTNDPTTVAMTP